MAKYTRVLKYLVSRFHPDINNASLRGYRASRNPPCLPQIVDDPSLLLAQGTYKAYDWAVTHNKMGHRCGYIEIFRDHPWYGLDCNSEVFWDLEVHGGLTFSQKDKPCENEGDDDGWWLGFDCAHASDARDYSLPGSHQEPVLGFLHQIDEQSIKNGFASVKDTEYVKNYCFILIEQAIAEVTSEK